MSFFESNSYFIDENVNFFKFENSYKVYNDKGEEIGFVKQKLSLGQKLLRLVMNKSMLPFRLEVRDKNDIMQASISRGWTFFMSKITIDDSNGKNIGYIKQRFKLFKPTFNIFSNTDKPVAIISGDWKAWNFVINDSTNQQIGTISKKWAGAMQELFTSADKYNVSIDPTYTNKASKIVVISSAITIDMVLKESK